jgi:hypothetical protein
MENISDKSCTENQNTHFMCNNFFLIMQLMRFVEKCFGVGQATDDNLAYAHCMLDT